MIAVPPSKNAKGTHSNAKMRISMPNPSNPTSFRERGGAWVLVQFLLMSAVVVVAVAFPGRGAHPWGIAVGIALLVTGAAFGIAGTLALGRNRTPFPRPVPGSTLVENGIYGLVRHPLYTSVILISIGWTLAWESGWAWVPALLQIPFFHGKARREERHLQKEFPRYADYARRVPRFIPRLR